MPMTTWSPEETARREAAMRAMTPYEIFTKAADIIEADPMLTPSAYTEPRWVNKVTGEVLNYYTDQPVADWDDWEQKSCHCLEGAMQEAGGVFTTDPAFPGWLVIIKGLERTWGEIWEVKLNAVLAQQFDLVLLQVKGYYEGCNSIVDAIAGSSANDVVYTYSDRVLAPMKRDGALEAARLLRAAAETVKEA